MAVESQHVSFLNLLFIAIACAGLVSCVTECVAAYLFLFHHFVPQRVTILKPYIEFGISFLKKYNFPKNFIDLLSNYFHSSLPSKAGPNYLSWQTELFIIWSMLDAFWRVWAAFCPLFSEISESLLLSGVFTNNYAYTLRLNDLTMSRPLY